MISFNQAKGQAIKKPHPKAKTFEGYQLNSEGYASRNKCIYLLIGHKCLHNVLNEKGDSYQLPPISKGYTRNCINHSLARVVYHIS